MKKRKQKKRLISMYAVQSELKMLDFIMKNDGRNSMADCLRNLIRERFFFLNQKPTDVEREYGCVSDSTTPVVVADKE